AGVSEVLAGCPAAVPAFGNTELSGCGGEFLPDGPDGLTDIDGDLLGHVAERLGQLILEVGEAAEPGPDLLPALVRDAVDLLAVDFLVRDQALFLEPGKPRVDSAGRRGVDAHEPVLQQADDLVAVPGRLIEELEQVQPELAMSENWAHRT